MAYDVIIIGAGISGLSAAHTLQKQGLKVLVLEEENEAGGLASSYQFPKFTIEKYYHHVFQTDQAFFLLLKELKLEDQLFGKTASVGHLIGNKIYRLDTPLDILRFKELSLADKFKLGLATLKAKKTSDLNPLDKISAKEWLIKAAGENNYEKFFRPLMLAKFGRAAESISAAWIVARIKLRSNRSLKGEKLFYLKNGFASFIEALTKNLSSKGALKTNTKVEQVIIENNKTKGVKVGSEIYQAKAILSTLPPQPLLNICRLPADLTTKLKHIKFQGNITAIIGLNKKLSNNYWINISRPDLPFGVIIEHTNFYNKAEYNSKIVYLSAYIQNTAEPLWQKTEAEVMGLYLDSLKRLFGIDNKNVLWWKLAKTLNAGPVYSSGYLSLIPSSKSEINGLYLAGMMQSFPERSVNDSIIQGRKAALEIIKDA